MGRKCSIEDIEKRLKFLYDDILTVDRATYVNVNMPARFIHKIYGEWWNVPKYILRKRLLHLEEKKLLFKKPIEKIREQLKEIFGEQVVIDETSYVRSSCKARFIDKEFGEWEAFVGNVINSHSSHPARAILRRKQTCLKLYGFCTNLQNEDVKNAIKKTNIIKYGVENPQQNRQISLKTAKSQNKSLILLHWKTQEEIICQGSYEIKVVEWLNKNKIDFDWQIPFDMPAGKRYFIDLFLKEKNLWVEIKGYKRPKNMEKWNWFHEERPNSELWDERKLKEMRILP